jgi:parallel beta-helix repeat protein
MLSAASNMRLVRAELTTIRVPEDFPTIQEAINAASPGNIIFVKAGIYGENVTINKAVSLVGEDPATTIIDGGGVGTVVNITADNARLTGFTIQNSSLEFGFYAGVYLRKARYCNISENIIKTNSQIGIYLLGSSYNIISRNNITHNGNGIWLTAIQEGYFVDFTLYNIISNNNITNNYYPLTLVYSAYNNVSGNNMAENQSGVWIEDSVDNTFLETVL